MRAAAAWGNPESRMSQVEILFDPNFRNHCDTKILISLDIQFGQIDFG